MSVALQSPFTGTKRLFDDSDSEAQQHLQQEAAKRVRCLGSPAGRCRPAAHASASHFQPSLPASTVAAIKALFPGMDSQVSQCGCLLTRMVYWTPAQACCWSWASFLEVVCTHLILARVMHGHLH